MGASFSFDQVILLVSSGECQLYGLNELCNYLYCCYPIKAPLNFIKLVHQMNSIHHLTLLLVRGTCRNIGVHLSYKHSLIVGFLCFL